MGIGPDWLAYLAPPLQALLQRARPLDLLEIRLRTGGPVGLVTVQADGFLTSAGTMTAASADAVRAEAAWVDETFSRVAQGSVYAWEDELRQGFITLPGGHRVGVVGRVVAEGGRLQTLRKVTMLNLRVARAVTGVAARVAPLLQAECGWLSTLLISPPGAGKTTLLRDLVRIIASGTGGLPGCQVAVVDERSEVAGGVEGVPQFDLGPRTDVLDGAPKAEGVLLVIRSMGPRVVAVDEIGRPEDAHAVFEALHAGVTVLATVHGRSLADVAARPSLRPLLAAGAFRRAVILSRRGGVGTVEQVLRWEGDGDVDAAAGGRGAPGGQHGAGVPGRWGAAAAL